MTVANAVRASTVVSHTADPTQTQEEEPLELLTNEIIVDRGKGNVLVTKSTYLQFNT